MRSLGRRPRGHAEAAFSALGVPASNAITMSYKQVILQRGLPFEVKPPEHPLDVSRMTAEQLDAGLEKGMPDEGRANHPGKAGV